MKWITRFLGLRNKEQKNKDEQAAKYIHKQKDFFTCEMAKVQNQAKKVHEKTRKAHQESVRLLEVVTDVTIQIAKATGNK